MASVVPVSNKLFERMSARFPAAIPCLHSGIVVLLGLVCYANSFHVPVQFDDAVAVRGYASSGVDLYSVAGLLGRSRWFADITFALNRQLHGEQVPGYHLVNLALHLATAVVIYLLLRQAIAALQRTYRLDIADPHLNFLQRFVPCAVASLFVCHPVQTQAVTYIVQRYTSLATLLYLGALLAYLLARRPVTIDRQQLSIWFNAGACLVLALLAMKSKEIAATLPLMLGMCEAALFRGQLLKKRLWWLLAGGLLLVMPLQLLSAHGVGGSDSLLDHLRTATAETQTITRSDYLLTQFRVVATYLRLLLLPVNQNMDYDYPLSQSLAEPAVLAALLLHLALAGAALVFLLRSRRCLAAGAALPGIALRLAALGICWFYLALSVESSVLPIRDVIFEHRLYLPSVGFFMAAAAALAGLAARRHSYRTSLWLLLAVLCLTLGAATIARNRVWSDELTMLQDVLAKSPNKARVSYAVGMLYYRKIMPEPALPYLVKALELDPDSDKYRQGLNEALWIIKKYRGRCGDGAPWQAAANRAKADTLKVWRAISYNNLGLAYEHLGKLELARQNYQQALAINPALDLAWGNLALAAALSDDRPAVAAALQQLQAINPQLARTVVNLIGDGVPKER